MKYQNIIFDVDGTLINTEAALLMSLQELISKEQNKNIEIEDLTRFLGLPSEKTLEILGIDIIHVTEWDSMYQGYSHMVQVYDGIKETLNVLKCKGIKLGVVTSRNRAELDHDLGLFELDVYFDLIVSADDTIKHKPNPEPILKYIEKADANNRELLYVGDTSYDMQCAKAANVDFALALWGAHDIVDAAYYLKQPIDLFSLL